MVDKSKEFAKEIKIAPDSFTYKLGLLVSSYWPEDMLEAAQIIYELARAIDDVCFAMTGSRRVTKKLFLDIVHAYIEAGEPFIPKAHTKNELSKHVDKEAWYYD